MSPSVVAAALASTVQRRASLLSLDPACQVTNKAIQLYGALYCLWVILTVSLSPGFYCLERSQTATPMSSISGSVCPAGHFCTEGSSVPSPCPAGSYRNETGGKGKDDCKPCPQGKQEIIQSEFLCRIPLCL